MVNMGSGLPLWARRLSFAGLLPFAGGVLRGLVAQVFSPVAQCKKVSAFGRLIGVSISKLWIQPTAVTSRILSGRPA
jgi:hypothetical protein